MTELTNFFETLEHESEGKAKPEVLNFRHGQIILDEGQDVRKLMIVKEGTVEMRLGDRHIRTFEGGTGKTPILCAKDYFHAATSTWRHVVISDTVKLLAVDSRLLIDMGCKQSLVVLLRELLRASDMAGELHLKLRDEFIATGNPGFNPKTPERYLCYDPAEHDAAYRGFAQRIMEELSLQRIKRSSRPSIRIKALPRPSWMTDIEIQAVPTFMEDRDDMRTMAMPALRIEQPAPKTGILTFPKGHVLIHPNPERIVDVFYKLLAGAVEIISDLGTSKEKRETFTRVPGKPGEKAEKTPILGARYFFGRRPSSRHYVALTSCTVETITQETIYTLYPRRECTSLVRELIRNSDLPPDTLGQFLEELDRRYDVFMYPGFRKEDLHGLLKAGAEDAGIMRKVYEDYACDMIWRFTSEEIQTDGRKTDMHFVPLERPF